MFNTVNGKPEAFKDNNFVNQLYDDHKKKKEVKKPITVLLFTDIHIDYQYREGTSIDCGLVVCCRDDSVIKGKSDMARKWGEYKCDIPEVTLLNMFEYINSEIKPDIALWGGDSIPHNINSYIVPNIVDSMNKVSS